MKAYSLDDYFELLKLKYEQQQKPLPARWRVTYRAMRALLRWGARQ